MEGIRVPRLLLAIRSVHSVVYKPGVIIPFRLQHRQITLRDVLAIPMPRCQQQVISRSGRVVVHPIDLRIYVSCDIALLQRCTSKR